MPKSCPQLNRKGAHYIPLSHRRKTNRRVLRGKLDIRTIRGLRQHVRLTGFDDAVFAQSCNKIHELGRIFGQSLPAGSLIPIELSVYEGHKAFDAHARYFTDRSAAPEERNLPFAHYVDPHDFLRRIQPQSLFHGPDNVVEYCQRVLGEDGPT